jgi:putative transposase
MSQTNLQQTAIARFTVIAPLLATGDPRPLSERIKEAASREWPQPDGGKRQFAASTIEGWFYAYRSEGLEALQDRVRSDKDRERSLPPEMAEVIDKLLEAHPKLRTMHVIAETYKTLGTPADVGPSSSTFYRHVAKKREVLKRLDPSGTHERRAFETTHPGALWQSDIMHGPHVYTRSKNGGQCKVPTYLLGILDDHSRLCVHGRFYFSQGLDALCAGLEEAVKARGIPEKLYVDNGMVFSGTQLRLICARIGTNLMHTKVRDAAAKGKIERFFKTVRTSFLDALLALHPPKTLEELNSAFRKWAEEEYNRKPHAGIDKVAPLERWLAGSACVRLLPNDGRHDHSFLLSEERLVRNDGTISFAGKYFEVDHALHGTKVEVRYHLAEPDRLQIYQDGRYIGAAKPLNRTLNSKLHRRKTVQTTAQPPQ